MLDGLMRRLLGPPLDAGGRALARRGVSADAVTGAALACGLGTAVAVAAAAEAVALVLLLAGRILDGLDGAVARATRRTDRGGYLDIVFDFMAYGALPLAFAIRAPETNALPAAALLFAFYVNGASFLAFAALAAKRGLETDRHGIKSIYFSAGLAEGTETVLFFVAMVLWPRWFPVLATAFAGLVMMSAIARIALAWRVFADEDEEP